MTRYDYINNSREMSETQTFVNNFLGFDTTNLTEAVCMYRNGCLNLYIDNLQKELYELNLPLAIHLAKCSIVSFRYLNDKVSESIVFNTISNRLLVALEDKSARNKIAEISNFIIEFDSYVKYHEEKQKEIEESAWLEYRFGSSYSDILR